MSVFVRDRKDIKDAKDKNDINCEKCRSSGKFTRRGTKCQALKIAAVISNGIHLIKDWTHTHTPTRT